MSTVLSNQALHALTIWIRMVRSGSERSTECGAGTRSATAFTTSILLNPLLARASITIAYCKQWKQQKEKQIQYSIVQYCMFLALFDASNIQYDTRRQQGRAMMLG